MCVVYAFNLAKTWPDHQHHSSYITLMYLGDNISVLQALHAEVRYIDGKHYIVCEL